MDGGGLDSGADSKEGSRGGAGRRHSKRSTAGTREAKRGAVKDEKKRKWKSGSIVDFAKLEMASLQRYRRFFKLNARQNATKSELIAAVSKHFAAHPKLRDQEVISAFLFANNRYLEDLAS